MVWRYSSAVVCITNIFGRIFNNILGWACCRGNANEMVAWMEGCLHLMLGCASDIPAKVRAAWPGFIAGSNLSASKCNKQLENPPLNSKEGGALKRMLLLTQLHMGEFGNLLCFTTKDKNYITNIWIFWIGHINEPVHKAFLWFLIQSSCPGPRLCKRIRCRIKTDRERYLWPPFGPKWVSKGFSLSEGYSAIIIIL